jgi:glucose dehydrogenase
MDWDTGTTLWYYTALDHDNCDCDFGEGPVDYVDHGQEYLVAGNKGGFVYALTPLPGRHSVQLAWSLKIAKPGFSGILYSFPEMPKHSSS